MKPKVYIETTIVSYLTAKPSRDSVFHGQQLVTQDWWENERTNYDLVTSQLTLDEAAEGDPDAAARRLAALDAFAVIEVTPDAIALAVTLEQALRLPARARADALHVALAATAAVPFVLTWNCTHLANGHLLGKIETSCRRHGVEPPRVLTPLQLMESP